MMNAFITYKDKEAADWIPGVKEVAHNSQMGALTMTTESRVYIFNFEMIRHVEMAEEGEDFIPTL